MTGTSASLGRDIVKYVNLAAFDVCDPAKVKVSDTVCAR